MSKRENINEEIFITTWKCSTSLTNLCKRLDIYPSKDNKNYFLNKAKELNLPLDHIINNNRVFISDGDFINLWENSTSISQILKSMGLSIYGANYKMAKERAVSLGLSKENLGINIKNEKTQDYEKYFQRSLITILQKNTRVDSRSLLSRLSNLGLFDKICSECSITSYHGREIVFELDHIDGDHMNNELDNLRVLCHNCHTQTDTYGSKKRH